MNLGGNWFSIGSIKIDTPLKKGLVIAIPFLLLNFLKKSKVKVNDVDGQKNTSLPSPEGYVQAFRDIADQYGVEYARNIERLYRLETNHFKSGGFLRSNTAGIVAKSNDFPYGWSSLAKFLKANNLDESMVFLVPENNGHTYVGFNSVYWGVMFTAWFIATVRDGNHLAWYGLTKERQEHYASVLEGVKAKIV